MSDLMEFEMTVVDAWAGKYMLALTIESFWGYKNVTVGMAAAMAAENDAG